MCGMSGSAGVGTWLVDDVVGTSIEVPTKMQAGRVPSAFTRLPAESELAGSLRLLVPLWTNGMAA